MLDWKGRKLVVVFSSHERRGVFIMRFCVYHEEDIVSKLWATDDGRVRADGKSSWGSSGNARKVLLCNLSICSLLPTLRFPCCLLHQGRFPTCAVKIRPHSFKWFALLFQHYRI